MPKRLSVLLFIGLAILVSKASAEDAIVTQLFESTEDGGKTSDVSFADASCEEECHIATLSCNESASIMVTLADIDAKDAASAMTVEEKQMVISAGGKSFDYSLLSMQFMEMTGSWWLTAQTLAENRGEMAGAIASAKNFSVRAGTRTVELPVDANVKSWAQACK